MITDYNYNYIFPECNQLQLQLHCNVIDYNYNYFLVVLCLKKFLFKLIIYFIVLSKLHAWHAISSDKKLFIFFIPYIHFFVIFHFLWRMFIFYSSSWYHELVQRLIVPGFCCTPWGAI